MVMERYWRYRRARDEMLIEDAIAVRAGGTDEEGWNKFIASRQPDTREIDPEIQPAKGEQKPKTVRRSKRVMTPEERQKLLEE